MYIFYLNYKKSVNPRCSLSAFPQTSKALGHCMYTVVLGKKSLNDQLITNKMSLEVMTRFYIICRHSKILWMTFILWRLHAIQVNWHLIHTYITSRNPFRGRQRFKWAMHVEPTHIAHTNSFTPRTHPAQHDRSVAVRWPDVSLTYIIML